MEIQGKLIHVGASEKIGDTNSDGDHHSHKTFEADSVQPFKGLTL